MTSLLRELEPVPKVGPDSTTTTSLPSFTASSRATAKPTTPAPITTTSASSLGTDPCFAVESHLAGLPATAKARQIPPEALNLIVHPTILVCDCSIHLTIQLSRCYGTIGKGCVARKDGRILKTWAAMEGCYDTEEENQLAVSVVGNNFSSILLERMWFGSSSFLASLYASTGNLFLSLACKAASSSLSFGTYEQKCRDIFLLDNFHQFFYVLEVSIKSQLESISQRPIVGHHNQIPRFHHSTQLDNPPIFSNIQPPLDSPSLCVLYSEDPKQRFLIKVSNGLYSFFLSILWFILWRAFPFGNRITLHNHNCVGIWNIQISIVPLPGVTSFMLITCSSIGGSLAPVP
ncbi:potassium-transporting ATPase C chain [Striga asiatica]|uniref:Potassium-transporting ATPase C chain n=1 Tax=Striga asiatica TaxID=4170 RepID=A0A5A7R549_STRAF|nr:potassium-transporting ATPase C chain [Striga asiatica]